METDGLERFPKEERISKWKEIERVLREGESLRGSFFTLFIRRAERRRFGILTKKIKGGVKRNKLRRRLREIYRKEKRWMEDGIEIVVVVGKEALEKTYWELREEFLGLLKKGGYWKGPS